MLMMIKRSRNMWQPLEEKQKGSEMMKPMMSKSENTRNSRLKRGI